MHHQANRQNRFSLWKTITLLVVANLCLTYTMATQEVLKMENPEKLARQQITESTPLPSIPSRLSVSEDGSLMLDGKPWRGIGVNYFSAFYRVLGNPQDHSYREGFRVLAEHQIPFVRFMAGGFYSGEMALYEQDKEAYFALMDGLVASAAEHGIGLVPSLFWWYANLPDRAGVPCGEWGNPDSPIYPLMNEYIADMVSRYRDNPTIWAWELGNEYDLEGDLPNALDHPPFIAPELGTPTTRGVADVLSSTDVITALRAFGKQVRKYDPVRPISSGNALTRAEAFHLRTSGEWGSDTVEQYQQMLAMMNPDPINLVSIHIYEKMMLNRFGLAKAGYHDLLKHSLATTQSAGKALFVGEFGASEDIHPDGWTGALAEIEAILAAIVETGVPMAAFWVFDYFPQNRDFNVTGQNHRRVVLEKLREANQSINKHHTE